MSLGIVLEVHVRIWYLYLATQGDSIFAEEAILRIQMKPGVFREEYIAIIVRELLRGLEYLHSEGKLHRDIKGVLILWVHLSS